MRQQIIVESNQNPVHMQLKQSSIIHKIIFAFILSRQFVILNTENTSVANESDTSTMHRHRVESLHGDQIQV